jgi:hypothetical protein
MKVYNMPELNRMIEVRDDWYPCYEKNGKRYVKATLMVIDCKKKTLWCSCNYTVRLCFWGMDDTGKEIDCGCPNLAYAYKEYKRLRKFLNHIQKMKAVNLKDYLYMHGFRWA